MYSECRDLIGARKVFDKMSHKNLYSWNHMLSGYTKLGMVKPAKKLFDKMPQKDIVSWNTMVIGYAKVGMCGEGLKCYKELRRSGIGYNEFTFSGLMMIGVKFRDIRLTMQAHRQVLGVGFLSNVVISCSILDAYAKSGGMVFASRLFDEMRVKDVLAWTTMVSGFAQCGDMEAANKVFNTMPVKNPVSWTSLIAGYARNGRGDKALELFTRMMAFRVRPDQFTFSSCLCACSSLASLKHGKQVHGHLYRTEFRPNTIVVSSLIDMYSKCGSLDACRVVFNIMDVNKKDVVLWNTMLSALAQHGRGDEAVRLLDDMVRSDLVEPNRITLVIVLNACSHSGLVEEGLRVFEYMTLDHSIVPDDEHYACLIDLLGRAGDFESLVNRLRILPCEPSEQIWSALLGVCSIHGNMELGKMAAGQLMKMQPGSSAAYLLLSSVYAELGRWDSVEKVREVMERRRIRKEHGISWVEKGSSLLQSSMAAEEEEAV
ncbi:Pentatricopeptide repeat-containing protein At2g21090 [Linum grandiflorum]